MNGHRISGLSPGWPCRASPRRRVFIVPDAPTREGSRLPPAGGAPIVGTVPRAVPGHSRTTRSRSARAAYPVAKTHQSSSTRLSHPPIRYPLRLRHRPASHRTLPRPLRIPVSGSDPTLGTPCPERSLRTCRRKRAMPVARVAGEGHPGDAPGSLPISVETGSERAPGGPPRGPAFPLEPPGTLLAARRWSVIQRATGAAGASAPPGFLCVRNNPRLS